MWTAKIDTKSAITLYKNNQMHANATKFNYMHTSIYTEIYFQCEYINIKYEDMVQMLGISIDKKLKFTSHVTEVIRKYAYQLKALMRKSKILSTKTKMFIYHADIEANLNYCPLIWINKNKTDVKHIENVPKLMVITLSDMKELGCGLTCQMHVKKPNISILLNARLRILSSFAL